MLKRISIENYILIDEAHIEFGKGLNVISGETGAGKSILLNALHCSFGKKGFSQQIKPGKTQMKVSSVFDISTNSAAKNVLKSLGIAQNDDLILSREVDQNENSSLCFINKKKCSVGDLRKISETLIEIHGQHSNYSLLSQEYPLELLDQYAKNALILEEYKKAFKVYQEKTKQLSYLLNDIQKIKEQKDYFLFTLSDLEGLVEQKEYEVLEESLKNLETKKSLYDKLSDLQEQSKKMEESINLSEHIISQVSDALGDANLIFSQFYELKESEKLFRETLLKEKIDFISDEEIDFYNHSLSKVDRLKKKYSKTLLELHLFKNEIEEKLSLIDNPPNEVALKSEIEALKETLLKLSKELHYKRLEAADEIAIKLKDLFADLSMKDSDIVFNVQEATNSEGDYLFNGSGFDRVDLLYRPSEMAPFKKLSSIASGGEISRISLAVKSLLSSFIPEHVIVYDEIDTGIGGKTALSVGKTLSNFSKNRQVIVITHLAQIAKYSDEHFLVHKESSTSRIKKLSFQEKIHEISRMLFGEQAVLQKLDIAKNFIEED